MISNSFLKKPLLRALSIIKKNSREFGSVQSDIWFPKVEDELDLVDKTCIDFVGKLGNSYPGYDDEKYMSWCREVRSYPGSVKIDPPDVDYPADATETWNMLYTRLRDLHHKHACKEHREILKELEDLNIYSPLKIPQFSQVNKFISGKSKFKLVPVGGMINPRSFLYGLAYRVFFCTRYIRHKSVPFYTPEPDVVHEFMGHVPMFANEDFAQLNETIGKKSLGASDEVIEKLSKIYFYAVEFGVLGDSFLGSGYLGSSSEFQYVVDNKNLIRDWNLNEILESELVLSDYQPIYYKARDLLDLKRLIIEGTEQISGNL
ncbi:unnamed protein product [Blepharisma stoltei]|uniref:phenylalanine 4-monooxygenase n=1 Tax=Blepharisma stoltei TaxID=1481888 RepID=A0AAU9IV27_9CILI|nr:unnamed protein product [Blepharisma stoltei]